MDFWILGPVRVLDGDRPVPLPGGRVRTLLTVLLLHANQVVTVRELVVYLWEDSSPERPRAAIQTHLGRLRKVLAGHGVSIRTVPDGYILDLDPADLDLGRFRELVRKASGTVNLTERVGLLTRALEIWRGLPLGEVAGAGLAREEESLVEERLYALERLVDAQLGLGQHDQVVAQLTTLTKEYPLRESFCAHLMIALYRSRRAADALRAYRVFARTLADELGIDPSDDLKKLHQQLLNSDPQLAAPAEAPARNYLPRDLPDFTGRRRELDVLTAMAGGGAVVSIAAVDGMAGVGKTALAVHAAHQLTGSYPDGQLFVDLHGYSDDRPPVEPAAALDMLLRLLGVPGDQIPRHLDERVARWRAELADRRILLVLDNAADAGQVAPLLPAGRGCLLLITSRRRLAELDGVEALTLDVLPADDAEYLFTRTAARFEEDVTEVTSLCGYLPLAIRLAAGRLRHRPAWRVEDLVRRLSDEQYRLAELAVGDSTVAGVFQVSYDHLNAEQQRLFRLLGLHPGPDIDRYAAAALANRPVRDTESLLEDLVDVHLLIQERPSRYRFHDLIRRYAHRLADERDAAVTRLLDHYLNTAVLAEELQYPERRHVQTSVMTDWTPPLTGPAEALGWFDAEYQNVTALVAYAATRARPGHAWRLALSVWNASLRSTDIDATVSLSKVALDAVRVEGDRQGEAMILTNLGSAAELSGELVPAVEYLQVAAEQFRMVGDRYGEGAALANLGYVLSCLGRNVPALEYYQRTLRIMQAIGHRRGVANSMCDIADCQRRLGRPEEALPLFRQALAIHLELGNSWDEADTRRKLAAALHDAGQFADSLVEATRAMDLFRDHEDPLGEAYVTNRAGLAHRALGRFDEAERYQRDALALFYGLSAEHSAELYNERADIHRRLGENTHAMDQYRAGLTTGSRTEVVVQQARAHEGIADLHPDPDVSRRHWLRALELYTELDMPDAARIGALLSECAVTVD